MRKGIGAPVEIIDGCRSCGEARLTKILDLGETPLADRLLTQESLTAPEPKAPLDLVFCENCSLVQILATVEPDVLFCNDYPYYSSVSPYLMKHFGTSAKALIEERNLGTDHLVVEAASNDGYMLRHFVEQGIKVLGVDPAEGPADKAIADGIPTLKTFFTSDLAEKLVLDGQSADVFLANNVLAHVADLNGFVAGIQHVLKDDGVAVIEAPYLVDLVEKLEFDTIYHQHLCYFSVTALVSLFRRHGLHLNRVVKTDIHGGSLRLFVEPKENLRESVRHFLKYESELGVTKADYYEQFGNRVERLKTALMDILEDIKRDEKRIAGYGAAAKANTLMSYCGIDANHLDFIADRNPHKQGRFMSGNALPICGPERIDNEVPDYLLILAWNFADEIINQQDEFRRRGGKFIIPVPEPHVVT